MNIRTATEVLFGPDRARLNKILLDLARRSMPIFGAGGDMSSEFATKVALGDLASLGAEVKFWGIAKRGSPGCATYGLEFRKRGNALDTSVYSAHPDIDEMLARFADGSPANANVDCLLQAGFGFRTSERAISFNAYNRLNMMRGRQVLASVQYRYDTALDSMALAVDCMDGAGSEQVNRIQAATFRLTARQMPDLAQATTKPFASSFANAVNVLAPDFKIPRR